METNLTTNKSECIWLETGEIAISEMLAAIHAARRSVRLETYTFQAGALGEEVRQALIAACERGVRVQVLIDAIGSIYLPDSFWKNVRLAGGDVRWFNPLRLRRPSFRDHRKVLVCDGNVAIIGGFNIACVYRGDGVNSGWRDLGMKVNGPLAVEMAEAFDEMFECFNFRHRALARLRKSRRQKAIPNPEGQLLLGGPSRNNPIRLALGRDLGNAREVSVVSAYFLPSWKIRRDLARMARRGGKVRLILPGKSDVLLSQLAGQSFYRRLISAGVEVYEYQPQILHTKLFIIDEAVYAGSANFDGRSLALNYEIMVRLSDAALAAQAHRIFDDLLRHSKRIELEEWRLQRTTFDRLKARLAHFILARIDPFLARHQLRG